MPTTKLSKRAEAIVKNSATLKSSPQLQPTSILGQFSGTQRPEFYERASADMRKLKEQAVRCIQRALPYRGCVIVEIMSYGLQHLGLPKMIWVALSKQVKVLVT